MTSSDDARFLAVAFLLGGGAVVSVGIGALVTYVRSRFDRFGEISKDAAETRAYIAGRVEVAISEAARATLGVSAVLGALDQQRRDSANATKARALTDGQARSLRLRAARARGERHPDWVRPGRPDWMRPGHRGRW